MDRASRVALLLSLASLLVTIPHIIEDFLYETHTRFGLALIPAALAVGVGFTFQVAGLVLLARGLHTGLWITLLAGAGWFFGAVFDHLPDILSTSPYREGPVSKALEILIILFGAGIAAASGAALARKR